MKKISSLSKKAAIDSLDGSRDSWFLYGEERFTGWHLGGFFYLGYSDGMEGARYYHISALVFLSGKEKTTARYHLFYGLTNPVLLLGLYLITLFVLYAADNGMSGSYYLLSGLIGPVMVAAVSGPLTYFSRRGAAGRDKLAQFIADNLKLEPV